MHFIQKLVGYNPVVDEINQNIIAVGKGVMVTIYPLGGVYLTPLAMPRMLI